MRFVLTFVFLFFLLLVGLPEAFAQPGNPAGNPDAPIGGIEILLGIGGLLGLKRIFSSREKKTE